MGGWGIRDALSFQYRDMVPDPVCRLLGHDIMRKIALTSRIRVLPMFLTSIFGLVGCSGANMAGPADMERLSAFPAEADSTSQEGQNQSRLSHRANVLCTSISAHTDGQMPSRFRLLSVEATGLEAEFPIFSTVFLGGSVGCIGTARDAHFFWTYLTVNMSYIFGASWTKGDYEWDEDITGEVRPHPPIHTWVFREHHAKVTYAKDYWFVSLVGTAWPSDSAAFLSVQLGYNYSLSSKSWIQIGCGIDYERVPNVWTACLKIKLAPWGHGIFLE
jgi:hypothetical protein